MAVFDDGVSNPTTNPDFNDILDERLSRRSMLGAGAAVAAVGFLGGGLLDASPAQAGVATRRPGTWTPVAPSVDDVVVVPDGYVAEPVYKWGQPIVPSGPAFDGPFNTAAEQEQQAGSEHDGMYYFPLDRRNRRGLLAMNHEASDQNFILPGGPDGNGGWSLEKARKSQSAHGVSVIEISAESGSWQVVESPYARRVTVNTPVEFSGPAANAPRIVGASGLGTVNNCANGWTPWGTYLTCEENINGYFGWDPASGYTPPTDLTRYTFTAAGFGYRWWEVDERFDPSKTPNEPYNFGWVVEIDPFDPDSAPVKRTALGRFKHENAALTEGRGNRAVVYMGDDERGEYIYKFVSDRSWRALRARGRSPFDSGTLYVATFKADGTGEWLPLVHGSGALTVANGFADQADVLIRARQAADAVGATRMDRPEWVDVHPRTGEAYCTLTNNTNRGSANFPNQPVDAANPRANNRFGHIIRWRETRRDAAATTFEWDIFVLAGDPANPTHGASAGIDAFGSPDGLWFDRRGRLWVQTDGSQPIACNNQMLLADPETGEVKRFLVGPKGCEITGITATPDLTSLFVNIQHPGEGGTAENPTAVSTWPDGALPRSATIAIRRLDGKPV